MSLKKLQSPQSQLLEQLGKYALQSSWSKMFWRIKWFALWNGNTLSIQFGNKIVGPHAIFFKIKATKGCPKTRMLPFNLAVFFFKILS